MDLNSILQPPAGQPQPGGPPTPQFGNKKLIIIAAAVIGLAVIGGIGRMIMSRVVNFGVRSAIQAGTGVKIDEKGNAVSFQGKNGEQVQYNVNGNSGTVTYKGENGETGKVEVQGSGEAKHLPTDFPADFPVMSGLAIDTTYAQSTPGQGSTFMITWTGVAKPDDATGYYRTELEKAGWTKTTEMSTDQTWTLIYSRKPDPAKDATDTATINIEQKTEGNYVLNLGLQLAPR